MSMFQVGDLVSISPNATNCTFGCNGEMMDLIGYETMITSVWVTNEDEDAYSIEADNGHWTWSENCFIAVDENEDEIAVSDDEFSGILSFLTASYDQDTTPPHLLIVNHFNEISKEVALCMRSYILFVKAA